MRATRNTGRDVARGSTIPVAARERRVADRRESDPSAARHRSPGRLADVGSVVRSVEAVDAAARLGDPGAAGAFYELQELVGAGLDDTADAFAAARSRGKIGTA